VALGEGRWASGAGLTALTLGIAGLAFAASLATAERLYYTGWASLQNKGRKARTPRVRAAVGAGLRPAPTSGITKAWAAYARRVLPAPLHAVLWKDWLVLRRDLRNMSQLVTPLIFGIIYAVMLLRDGGPSGGLSEAPGWLQDVMHNVAIYINVGLSLFVGWMLLGRLAGMGFSQEGRSYWLIKTAPLNAGLLIGAKFLAAYLPALTLSWLYLLAITLIQQPGLSIFFYALAVVALCLAGNAGISLAFGIAGANLNWEDPRQMQRAAGSCLGALATTIYLPASLLLFFGPPIALPVLFGLAGIALPQVAGQAVGLALGGGVSLACAAVPLWLVRQRVERLGEN
jgi:ABC-2 type transport system permease protein